MSQSRFDSDLCLVPGELYLSSLHASNLYKIQYNSALTEQTGEDDADMTQLKR